MALISSRRPTLRHEALWSACITAPLLVGLIVMPVLGEQTPARPLPELSQRLFEPGHVLQVEIRLDPKDWHALRIGHRQRDEATGEVLAVNPYSYYKAEVTIDGRPLQPVRVRKKGYIG